MPARLRPMHQDDVRAKIQTSQLLNRLSDHALGKVELAPTQVRSIEVLLKKVLPDLQAVEHSGGVSVQTYDLSHVSDEALAALEGVLGSAQPIGSDQSGAVAPGPDSVH